MHEKDCESLNQKSALCFFLGPAAGGLKLSKAGDECIVITPESTLGQAFLGKCCGDELQIGRGGARKTFSIIAVS